MMEMDSIPPPLDTKGKSLTRESADELGRSVLKAAQQVADNAIANYPESYNDLHSEQPDLCSYELHHAIINAPRYVGPLVDTRVLDSMSTECDFDPVTDDDPVVFVKLSYVEYMTRTAAALRGYIEFPHFPRSQGVSSTLSRYIYKISELARASEMKMFHILDSSSLVGSRHGTSIISLIDSEGEGEFTGLEEEDDEPASRGNEGGIASTVRH